MKAMVYSRYGAPDVLQIADRQKPAPGRKELLVRVMAAEATKADCELRSFNFPVKWFSWPLRLAMGVTKPRREILGAYFAGVVEEVGADVTRFQVGDEIFGSSRMRFGAYGEYVTVPEHYSMTTKPKNMSFEEAAAVPLGGFNALHFMRQACIEPGERMLINGAGGSIGAFALQIAKSKGAHVTAVDAPHKEGMLRELGADAFVDYTKQDFTQQGERYDIVFDMVADSSYSGCMGVLNERGRYITGNPSFEKMVKSSFVSGGKKALFAFADETLEELETLRDMIEAGVLRAPIDRVFPASQAANAHHRVQNEERCGVVVLTHQW